MGTLLLIRAAVRIVPVYSITEVIECQLVTD